MVAVYPYIGNGTEQRLYHLICGLHIVKTAERYSVAYTRIMRIKCDYVLDTHRDQLLQGHGAVKRLSRRTAVLPAFIQHRHYNIYSLCLTSERRYHTLKILKMVVRAHGHGLSVHLICDAVVEAVTDNKYVKTSGCMIDKTLCLARAESRALRVYNIGVLIGHSAPLEQIIIHLRGELLASAHGNYSHIAVRHVFNG